MRNKNLNPVRAMAILLLGVVLIPAVSGAQAPDPVTVTFESTGVAEPNRQVRVTANIEINDGSSLESVLWSQTEGVPANLANPRMETVRVRLGAKFRYRAALIDFLSHPPISADQLPPNIPVPDAEEGFPGGLRDRFEVVGINPFSLEEAGLVELELLVRTSSGNYTFHYDIETELPYHYTAGIRNVPIGVPVLLQSKEQDSYDWRLTPPPDSGATLTAATTRNPEFVPDVGGIYTLEVTDLASGDVVSFDVYAGSWRGTIVGEDDDGRPVVDGLCTACHRQDGLAPDTFTPWAQTGHAEIFKDSLNFNTHYSSRCFSCHTVGYQPDVDNGGIDEASDFQAFLDSGLIGSGNPNNYATLLDEFERTAQFGNIQCENCHGPQNTEPGLDTLSHGWQPDLVVSGDEPRQNLASDMCATCHGEPPRHGRFQQWQLSSHANYDLAIDESQSGSCSRCHTANGFLAWLPILTGEEAGDPTESIEVTWSEDESHPQTCVTCHDPHDVGTRSGSDPTVTIRLSGNSPPLIGGFQVLSAGHGAICMTCHNSRRGLRNDATFADLVGTSEVARAPHGSSQTDVLMGENAFFVNVGVRGSHSFIENTCVQCHMEATPPPDQLSYNQSGTNHTFFASTEICVECHTGINPEVIQTTVDAVLEHLQGVIEEHYIALLEDQIALGNTIDLDGEAVIGGGDNIDEVIFGEFRGRQSIEVVVNGTLFGPFRLPDITVMQPAPLGDVGLHDVADPDLLKAGWNWNLVNNDGSRGTHNPRFVFSVLDGARDALGDQGGPRTKNLAFLQ